MTQVHAIEVPLPKGVTDFLPEQADKIGYIQDKINRVFELWGFRRIITPALEFLDVLSIGLGEDLREKVFRFDDRQTGKLLAIPPDITPQIARIVATKMSRYPLPFRISYNGRVLRHAELQSGRSREILQAGVELIGLDSPEADAEMIAMAVEALKGLGLEEFKIDLGHIGFYRGIMEDAGLAPACMGVLQEAIAKKDASAVRAILTEESLSAECREAITALPRLFGGREVLVEAARVAGNDRSRKALATIAEVLDILDVYGVTEYLTIDLGEIRGLDYHSGMTFEGFVTGVGEPVCGGGRYDDLMGKYGFHAPATGFAFNILALLNALDRRPDVEASTTRDCLIFNCREDRREALEIARCLRDKGYSATRDIIRRDLHSSLAYARRMNIVWVLVIGDSSVAADELVFIRVSDERRLTRNKSELFRDDFMLANLAI